MRTGQNQTAGYHGHKVYASGDNTGLKLQAIIPNADATMTNVEVDGADASADLGWGNGLIGGRYYPVPLGSVYTRINIDQGFVGYYGPEGK